MHGRIVDINAHRDLLADSQAALRWAWPSWHLGTGKQQHLLVQRMCWHAVLVQVCEAVCEAPKSQWLALYR